MATTYLWQQEHPRANVPQALSDHPELLDSSYHHDVAPSFIRRSDIDADYPVRLWVQYENPEDREDPALARYAVVRDAALATDDCELLYEGEDMEAALAALLGAGR